MKRPSEEQIIKIFQSSFGNKKFVSEDVEFLKIGNTGFVFKIDTLVASTDVPPGMSMNQISRKSVVACVSDFAAKGVKPLYGFVSIVIPRNFSEIQIKKLSQGFRDAAKEFGFKMIGGDTNEGKELSLNVCLFGISDQIIHRSGAALGDSIYVTGPFGYTSSGLKLILKKKKSDKKFQNKAKKLVMQPKVSLSFGLSIKKMASSSMDSSDGLSTSLNQMARQSGKKFIITKTPTKQDIIEFASKNRLDVHDLVYNGGEEYEIVFTSPQKNKKKLFKLAKKMKVELIEIGHVTSGKGVFLDENNRKTKISDKGWRHFRS